jgi:hypothetical protein
MRFVPGKVFDGPVRKPAKALIIKNSPTQSQTVTHYPMWPQTTHVQIRGRFVAKKIASLLNRIYQ